MVKDVSGKVSVYLNAPEGIVQPKLYTHLDAKQSAAVRKVLATDARLTSDLNTKGVARIGKRSKSGIKPAIRTAIAENKPKASVPAKAQAPAKQQQNAVPAGVPMTKAGTPDKRYKAAKAAVPAAKAEGEAFDYAAMAAYADAIEKLVNAGFSKNEAKKMAAALR